MVTKVSQGVSAVPYRRNVIINGDFDIWQRGITLTQNAITNRQYLADRFCTNTTSSYNTTTSQSTNVVLPSVYSLLIANNTAVTSPLVADYLAIEYHIEGYDLKRLYGDIASLSFLVKSSVPGTYSIAFRTATDYFVTTYNISAANTWERIHVTVPVQGPTFVFDQNLGMSISWTLSSGSNGIVSNKDIWQVGSNVFANSAQINWAATAGATFQISQVQFEPGPVSSPFEHIEYNYELQRCQRYYQQSYPKGFYPGANSSAGCIFSVAASSGVGGVELFNRLPVQMRPATVNPTIYSSSGAVGMMHTSGNIDISAAGQFWDNSLRIYNSQVTTAGVTHYAHYTIDVEL